MMKIIDDKFVRYAGLDAQMIGTFDRGEPLAPFPLFHERQTLTFRGAYEIAKLHGIEFPSYHLSEAVSGINTDNPIQVFTAIVHAQYQKNKRAGAGYSKNRRVALGLAYRAAIQAVLPMQSVVDFQMTVTSNHPDLFYEAYDQWLEVGHG